MRFRFAITSVILGLFLLGWSFEANCEPRPTSFAPQIIYGDEAFGLAINILVRNAEYQRALELLETRQDVMSQEAGFRLRIQLLIEVGRTSEALYLLETYLLENPNDALSRFQLGEIHFRSGRDRAATSAFSLALAGALPSLQTSIANERLRAIHERRPVQFNLSMAVVPDSNINSAGTISEIEIFGLPFELDENARQKSGTGIELNGSIERTEKLNDDIISRVSISSFLFDTGGNKFDIKAIELNSAIEAQVDSRLRIALGTSYASVWFGNEYLESNVGINVESDYFAQNRRWRAKFSTQMIGGTRHNRRSGNAETLEINRVDYLSPSSFLELSVGYTQRSMQDKSQSYSQGQISIGRLYPTPLRTNTYLQASYLVRNYKGRTFLFPQARTDQEFSLAFQITKPNWVIFEAHPFVAFEYSRNNSNISLNDYERNRVRFGLSYEF